CDACAFGSPNCAVLQDKVRNVIATNAVILVRAVDRHPPQRDTQGVVGIDTDTLGGVAVSSGLAGDGSARAVTTHRDVAAVAIDGETAVSVLNADPIGGAAGGVN